MKRFHRFGLALLFASLSGCAELVLVQHPVDDATIERWMDEKRYSKVLEVLERRAQRSNELDAEKRLETVRAQAAEYDQERARAARQLLEDGKLDQAEEVLNLALNHFPDGEQLQQAAQQLRRIRQNRIDALETKLLLAQADWLSESVPIYQQLATVEPSNLDAIRQARRMEQERSEVAQRLAAIGLTAHAEGDTEAAKRYLAASKKLQPSVPVTDVLDHLGKQERRKKIVEQAQQREVATRKKRQEAQQLADRTRQALQHLQLQQARSHVQKLEQVDPEFAELDTLRLRLELAIDTRVESLLKTGDDHYADGRIAEAKRVWEAGLALAPENTELTNRVERAERVLNRLQELREENNGGG